MYMYACGSQTNLHTLISLQTGRRPVQSLYSLRWPVGTTKIKLCVRCEKCQQRSRSLPEIQISTWTCPIRKHKCHLQIYMYYMYVYIPVQTKRWQALSSLEAKPSTRVWSVLDLARFRPVTWAVLESSRGIVTIVLTRLSALSKYHFFNKNLKIYMYSWQHHMRHLPRIMQGHIAFNQQLSRANAIQFKCLIFL